MTTIVVPVDFSPITRHVIRMAARLAQLAKGRLLLLHSVQSPILAADSYGITPGSIAEYVAAAEAAADRQLAQMKSKLRATGISTEAVRTSGLPSYQILTLARKRGAGYIVMGSYGHTAIHDLFVGSTTRGVLKRATCPVVVVPPGKRPPASRR